MQKSRAIQILQRGWRGGVNALHTRWRGLVVAIPYGYLLLFFLAPFFIVLKISFAEAIIASPPYSRLAEWTDAGGLRLNIWLDNFAYLWRDPLYVKTYWNSLKIAALSTLGCLLLGYPMAYYIARAPKPRRYILLFLIILPFWTSFLLRVYALTGLLADHGALNNFLLWLGVISRPLPILYSTYAVYIGIIYTYLPFMTLPLYANLEKLDRAVLEAAADLGARPRAIFFSVTLPLTLPGIIAGCLLVFIPATGEFIIPDLLGGGNVPMIGKVLYSEFNANHDWPVAAAVAIALLIVLVAPMTLYQHLQGKAVDRQARGG